MYIFSFSGGGLRIYWDFHQSIKMMILREKNSSVEENALLLLGVTGQNAQTDCRPQKGNSNSNNYQVEPSSAEKQLNEQQLQH